MHCLKSETFKTSKGRLVVQYGVQFIRGNRSGYFTVTGELYEGRQKEPVTCGCIHSDIRKVTHRFDDLIALHLCDEDGLPMHALENGFFYLRRPEEFSASTIARHFRILEGNVDALRLLDKPELAAWIETQRPRWKAEAEAAILKHGLKPCSE